MIAPQVGTSQLRFEGNDKITGKTRYIDDLFFNDVIYGATVRSKVPRGILREIKFDSGIPWQEFTIVRAKDIIGRNYVGSITDDQPYLVEQRVNHVHEAIVLIAHPDENMLRNALQHIECIIDPLPPIFDIASASKRDIIAFGQDNILSTIAITKGQVFERHLPDESITVAGSYETEAQEQLYIEPNGMVARVENGVMTVHGSMQCPFYIHNALKILFDASDDKIRVIQSETGGAFGGKEDYPSVIAGHAALLACKSGKTVKLIYSREEDMLATTKRHPSIVTIKSRHDRLGKFLAIEIDVKLNGGAYTTVSPVVLSRGAIHALGPYYCANVLINGQVFATNLPPCGAFRGFGAPQTIFAIERHMDRVARLMNIAPDEFRRRNFVKRGESTATGQIIREEADITKVMDRALLESDYHRKKNEFALINQQNHREKRGIGLSTFWHGAGFTGSGEHKLASVVRIGFSDGRIRIFTSSTEMGQGTNTILRQIVSEALGISQKYIDLATPDTHLVPNSGPTVASRTCMIVGGLLKTCAEQLLTQLHNADLLGGCYSSEDFIRAAGHFEEKHGPLNASQQYVNPPGLNWNEEKYSGDAYPCFVRAAYVAEVKVDLATCEVRVERVTAVQEVGKVINQILAEGQIEGGVTQGIGFAVMEKVVWRHGSMANAQLTNYIIPTASDAADIKVVFEEGASEHGPHGAKGIGELPLDGTAPAIISAIEHATGWHINRIPALPEDLMKLRDNHDAQ